MRKTASAIRMGASALAVPRRDRARAERDELRRMACTTAITSGQQAIALRGKVTYLADLPAPPGTGGEGEQAGRGGRGQGTGQGGQGQGGQQLGPPEGRAWVYWAENVKLE